MTYGIDGINSANMYLWEEIKAAADYYRDLVEVDGTDYANNWLNGTVDHMASVDPVLFEPNNFRASILAIL